MINGVNWGKHQLRTKYCAICFYTKIFELFRCRAKTEEACTVIFLHCAFSSNIACICLIFQLSFSIFYCSVIFLLIYPALVWWSPLQGEDWGAVFSDEQPRGSEWDWGEFWNFNDMSTYVGGFNCNDENHDWWWQCKWRC